MDLRIESGVMRIKQRIAITGRPGVGKTTLIEQVLQEIMPHAGGILGKEILTCGHRVGFALIDIATGEQGILAHIHQRTGPKIGKYTVNLKTLEELAVPAIARAIRDKELVVIDEFAPMELCSPQFVPVVQQALASERSLLIATHATLDHPLVHEIRQTLDLVRVKLSNRDALAEKLAARFRTPNEPLD